LAAWAAEWRRGCSLQDTTSRSTPRVLHFGTVGAGTAYKLVINLMGAVQIAAAAEGMALGGACRAQPASRRRRDRAEPGCEPAGRAEHAAHGG